ncbi:hypothetical protein MKW94_016252 [Papaver nudicaule]|uniref:Pectinesterase inhibitor domain-containing protein n=1 Tax=Papaver nudicaule TaxID=74823 RepID=A0AA42B1U0_PAPNU|nr:hypothetical protein [Papaver nudicaule]
MNPSLSLFLSSIFIFLVLHFHGVNGDLISHVCKNASTPIDYPQLTYDFCVASLSENPASKHAHLSGLGVISMQKCLQNATSIHSHIIQILKDGKEAPVAKPYISYCLDRYSEAITAVQKATASFKIRDYSGANTQMTAAMDASYWCEHSFHDLLQEDYELTSPLTKQNDDFFRLSGISLAITNMAITNTVK